MARPKVKIDLGELEKLCGLQCTDEEIAAFFGVSTKTITRRRRIPRFAEAMEHAKAKGRVSVRRNRHAWTAEPIINNPTAPATYRCVICNHSSTVAGVNAPLHNGQPEQAAPACVAVTSAPVMSKK